MGKYIAILLVFTFLLAFTVEAQELEYNIYDFKIKYGSVLAVNEMVFKGKINISSAITIPKDAKGILLLINNENIKTEITENEKNKLLAIDKKNIERIRLSFITEEMIDENEFIANIWVNYPTELLQVSLTLQPGVTLDEPMKKESKSSGSIYPKPDKIDIDKQSLIFIWERRQLKAGDEVSIFVRFKQKSSMLWIAIPIAMFFLILLFYIYYLKQYKPRTIIKKDGKK